MTSASSEAISGVPARSWWATERFGEIEGVKTHE